MKRIDGDIVIEVSEAVGAEKCKLFYKWCMEHAHDGIKEVLEKECYEHYCSRDNSTFQDGYGTAYNVAMRELRAMALMDEE